MSASEFLQSKFFRPCLNTAIFDGPVRFYFAQHQEGEALRLYSSLRSEIKDIWNRPAHSIPTIYLVQYPTAEDAELAGLEADFARFDLNSGLVLGFRGDEDNHSLAKMRNILFSFENSETEGLQSF